MQKQKFIVTFDDGPTIEAEVKSRDLALLERDGIVLADMLPMKGSYTMVLTVLQRMKRAGAIDIDLPADADAMMDVADIDIALDADVEGEGSGQVATPGKPLN